MAWCCCEAPPCLQPRPPRRRLLARLARLHGAPDLRPQRAGFSLAAFCLRSVLDDFAERMGPDLMPSRTLVDGGDGEADGGGEAAAGCPALASLAAADGLLDSRFLHLCCPALDHARQLFSAGSAAGGGGAGGPQQQEQARRVKKIRPTAPSGAAAARAALQVRGCCCCCCCLPACSLRYGFCC